MSEISNLTQKETRFRQWFEIHPSLGISMMDHLYNRLDGAYPHKWRSNFPDKHSIDNWGICWAEAFDEEGITPNHIKAGIKAVRTRFDWPPSCAEFIKECQPAVDPMVSYYEAVAGLRDRARGEMGKWSHPAIYWAATKMAFDLTSQTYSQVKARWEIELQACMSMPIIDAIPSPMKAIEAPGKSILSREKAGEMLNQIGASGILKQKTDHLAWAKKILEKAKLKNHGLSALQINFANEALSARQ